MAKENAALLAFNRGLISRFAAARIDLKRMALSAEGYFTNWLPKVLGSMSLRQGFGWLGSTKSNAAARFLPFVFAVTDTAIVELTSGFMRVWESDALVTRPTVATAIANGTFDTTVASWTDVDDVGGVSVWATGGYLSLTGDGTNAAAREQLVSVAVGDRSVLHAVRITVYQGECYFSVGSTSGGQEYVADTFLYPGVHSIAFTPTGDFYVRVYSREAYPTLVDSIAMGTAGVMSLPTPWTTAQHLQDIRTDQSGDVIFVACNEVKQKRIERRSNSSWSVVDYVTDDGPFRPLNTTPVRIAPAALTGATTLTATAPLFHSTQVGALFRLTTDGQNVTASLSAQDTYTSPIRVTGITTNRAFTRVISGTWVGTLTLQRSVGDVGAWEDVSSVTNGTVSYNDTFDNQIIYYRIGFKTGNYTSGTAVINLIYTIGSTTGIARITGYTSTTVVSCSVMVPFGGLISTAEWSEGAWSDYRGYPSAVAIHESRLWWVGKDKQWGSVVDAYHTFNDTTVGDSGPISRSIGSGPVDKIRWLLSSNRLVIGAQGAEWTARSSSLEEPLTPTNFNLKSYSSRGSGSVPGIVVDQGVVFVDRSGSRVFELAPDGGTGYNIVDLTALVPEVGLPSITRVAVQRQPDTRVHFVRSDGKVAMLVYDKVEEVRCWLLIETDGTIEDVVVIPRSTGEDQVYYVVNRTINAATVRFLEKWALSTEAEGGNVNKQADAYLHYSGAATATITGLGHLEGESVVCWADGKDRGTYTVSGGSITLAAPTVSEATVGLTYKARFRSAKLAYAAQGGTPLSQTKRVDHVSLVLADTHYQGLKYGPDFDNLDELPLIEEGAATAADTIHAAYDGGGVEFNGTYDTDSRICLEANAPRPCTVLAAVVSIVTHG